MIALVIILAASAPDTLWSNVTSGGVYSSVTPGDLNGDSIGDVVCGVNFWDDQPTLWCMSGDNGDTLWTSGSYKGIYQDEGLMAVPDMNGDGYGDIVVATPGGYAPPGRCLILVSGADGSLIWQWSAYENIPTGAGWGYSCAMMEDQTGDGKPEFIGGFGSTGSANSSASACLDGATGDTLWTRTEADAVEDLLVLPDITSDGIQDVCMGLGGSHYTVNTVQVCSGADGTVQWTRTGGGDVMGLDLVDREDTDPWIVSCSWDGAVECHTLGGDSLWARQLGGWLLDVEAGADLNGDGVQEIAVAADDGGTVWLDGFSGSIIWSYATGSNTWSVAWIDSASAGTVYLPCIAGGSVNGRRITVVNAWTGDLLWSQDFTERVYNVSSLDLGYPVPVVLAGLQDQQSQPHHCWAFSAYDPTSCEEGVTSVDGIIETNPVSSVLVLTPPDGTWKCSIYDVSGRCVWNGELDGDRAVDVSGWSTGCYYAMLSFENARIRQALTVIR